MTRYIIFYYFGDLKVFIVIHFLQITKVLFQLSYDLENGLTPSNLSLARLDGISTGMRMQHELPEKHYGCGIGLMPDYIYSETSESEIETADRIFIE